MEQDMRTTPPLSGPNHVPPELPTNANWCHAEASGSHATAPGAAGLAPAAPGSQTSAPNPGAAGRVPAAPGGHASTQASGAAGLAPATPGGHESSAASRAAGLAPVAPGGAGGAAQPCWGSITSLREPLGAELFAARLQHMPSGHKWLFSIRMTPVDQDHNQPTDAKFIRNAIACFLDEQLVNDAGISISRDAIKSGGIRPTRLAGWPQDERFFSFECHLDLPAALTSTFMRRMLERISGDTSILDPLRDSDWDWITPPDSPLRFAVVGFPSVQADHFSLVAYSEEAPAAVTTALQAALSDTDATLLAIACHPRYIHQVGILTEVICLSAATLSMLIKRIPHLGTPEALVASAACYAPIRTLHIASKSAGAPRNTSVMRNPSQPDELADPNPVWHPKVERIIQPRQILRPADDSAGHEGPHRFLAFRYSLGLAGDIVTLVAMRLAGFFGGLTGLVEQAAKTLQYWQPRIWVKARSNKPVRVFIAVSWGQLFAGVYQALQGVTLDRIDRITKIALSTGICLCIRCLGGLICWRCGRPGHAAATCPQNEFTPYAKVSYTCIFCGDVGSRELGHEFDICKKPRFITMTSPDSTQCGICCHMEHSTVQCPGIYCQTTKSVILLDKMRCALLLQGWSFGDSADLLTAQALPSCATSSLTDSPSSQAARYGQRSSGEVMSQSGTASLSSQSSTPGTALATVTEINALVMSEIRSSMAAAISEQLSSQLLPIHNGIKQINTALEMQGSNIDSLTEMLDSQGLNLARLESQALTTRQRLQRMMQARSQPAPSQHSAEDDQDAMDEREDAGLKSPSGSEK